MSDRATKKATITNCARCGGDHPDLVFTKLARPILDEYTHWAACPKTGEPVIMQITDDVAVSPWVFEESGDFMVCTDGQDGGTVLEPTLYPAFDYERPDSSTTWCVRYAPTVGPGTPVAEILDGVAQDMLTGLVVDGHPLTESEADGLDHALRGYLAALFSMAPKMHVFIRDHCMGPYAGDTISTHAHGLLAELARKAKQ
jgi:hypothetical protein